MATTRSEERAEFLATILTTAIEGGISYWAHVEDYRWGFRDLGQSDGSPLPADVQPYAAAVVEDAEEGGTIEQVTIDTIARGLRVIRENERSIAPSMRANIMLADRTNGDEGDIDAGDADCILQAGMFGEVIYG